MHFSMPQVVVPHSTMQPGGKEPVATHWFAPEGVWVMPRVQEKVEGQEIQPEMLVWEEEEEDVEENLQSVGQLQLFSPCPQDPSPHRVQTNPLVVPPQMSPSSTTTSIFIRPSQHCWLRVLPLWPSSMQAEEEEEERQR